MAKEKYLRNAAYLDIKESIQMLLLFSNGGFCGCYTMMPLRLLQILSGLTSP